MLRCRVRLVTTDIVRVPRVQLNSIWNGRLLNMPTCLGVRQNAALKACRFRWTRLSPTLSVRVTEVVNTVPRMPRTVWFLSAVGTRRAYSSGTRSLWLQSATTRLPMLVLSVYVWLLVWTRLCISVRPGLTAMQ